MVKESIGQQRNPIYIGPFLLIVAGTLSFLSSIFATEFFVGLLLHSFNFFFILGIIGTALYLVFNKRFVRRNHFVFILALSFIVLQLLPFLSHLYQLYSFFPKEEVFEFLGCDLLYIFSLLGLATGGIVDFAVQKHKAPPVDKEQKSLLPLLLIISGLTIALGSSNIPVYYIPEGSGHLVKFITALYSYSLPGFASIFWHIGLIAASILILTQLFFNRVMRWLSLTLLPASLLLLSAIGFLVNGYIRKGYSLLYPSAGLLVIGISIPTIAVLSVLAGGIIGLIVAGKMKKNKNH